MAPFQPETVLNGIRSDSVHFAPRVLRVRRYCKEVRGLVEGKTLGSVGWTLLRRYASPCSGGIWRNWWNWDFLISCRVPDAVTANLSTLSVSAQERAAKDAAKKEAKAAQSEARDAEKKAASKVLIKRVERNKRKHVTVITGLEVFGLENKKIAKDLGKKFATGSSMTRSPAGAEEITVQGDVSDDVREWLLEVHGDKVPEANIELIEDKKKKKAEGAV